MEEKELSSGYINDILWLSIKFPLVQKVLYLKLDRNKNKFESLMAIYDSRGCEDRKL